MARSWPSRRGMHAGLSPFRPNPEAARCPPFAFDPPHPHNDAAHPRTRPLPTTAPAANRHHHRHITHAPTNESVSGSPQPPHCPRPSRQVTQRPGLTYLNELRSPSRPTSQSTPRLTTHTAAHARPRLLLHRRRHVSACGLDACPPRGTLFGTYLFPGTD